MAISTTGRPHVGLCHGVQGTSRLLAAWIDAPYEQVSYRVAGINHQAWFLEFRYRHEDAHPLLRERLCDPEIVHEEPIRVELRRQFGYFVTESSVHASEYLPYFRKPMVDPLTSAVCTVEEIRRMVNDLFAAEEAWLPQFQRSSVAV